MSCIHRENNIVVARSALIQRSIDRNNKAVFVAQKKKMPTPSSLSPSFSKIIFILKRELRCATHTYTHTWRTMHTNETVEKEKEVYVSQLMIKCFIYGKRVSIFNYSFPTTTWMSCMGGHVLLWDKHIIKFLSLFVPVLRKYILIIFIRFMDVSRILRLS